MVGGGAEDPRCIVLEGGWLQVVLDDGLQVTGSLLVAGPQVKGEMSFSMEDIRAQDLSLSKGWYNLIENVKLTRRKK